MNLGEEGMGGGGRMFWLAVPSHVARGGWATLLPGRVSVLVIDSCNVFITPLHRC